jgi:hypothetical protein
MFAYLFNGRNDATTSVIRINDMPDLFNSKIIFNITADEYAAAPVSSLLYHVSNPEKSSLFSMI